MSFQLTQTTRNLSQQLPVEPIIILEINGLSLSFGTDVVEKTWNFDEGELFDNGLFFDGVVADENSRGYIQEKGTTSTLSSQVEIEEGGIGSVQKFNINLIDKDNEVSRLLTPGNEVDDPLTRDANVYLGFKGGAHPVDSVRIFTGIIDSIIPGAGNVTIGLSHPDSLKRQSIFEQNSAKLDGAITDSDTTISLTGQAFTFLEETDTFKTYIVIGDEIIQYTGLSGDDLTGCVRGSLNTIAVSHDDQAELISFYRLLGNPIDLSLRIMMSNAVAPIATASILNFNQVTASEYVPNSIFIEDLFFDDTNGLTGGELVTITNSINPANDVIESEILNITHNATGTILVLADTLITETDSTATMAVKSQYDILPSGCGLGMKHSQVDVLQHQEIQEQYGNQFPDYDFYIKDTIKAKDFLAQQIYFPAGLYSLIRKGRSSVQITVPPLDDGELVELTSSNVLNPGDIAPERSINKYFYNNITYKYALDSLSDSYLAGNITLSARSGNRLPVGNKPLTIISDGLRDNDSTTVFITRQARRFTDRFQFAAEMIKVKTNFKTGWNAEVGDSVLFGDADLKVYDSTTGTRDFKPRLMEIVNRSLSLTGATVTLWCLDTQFSSDARYGTVSPNSILDSGSTTTSLKVIKSYNTGEFELERNKWSSFIGEKIIVRDEEFNYVEETTILAFDPTDETRITLFPALPIAPSAGFIIDLPAYDIGGDKMKSVHCFATPRVSVASGASGISFDVAGGDVGKFFVGGFIRIHSEDFSVDSTPTLDDDDLEITDITSNTITVNRDMGFTPSASEFVSLIGFSSDNGVPYRFT